jgi:hypothetical protein
VPEKHKWRFYEMMQFTRDVFTPAPMIGNLPSTQASQDDDSEEDLADDADIPTQDNVEDEINQPPEPVEVETPELNRGAKVAIIDKNLYRPHRAKSTLIAKQDMDKKMIELEEKKLMPF